MLNSQIPTKIPTPFAVGAGSSYVRPIPQTTAVPGEASFQVGFPPITFTPLNAGGIPADGRDVNGILNMISAWCTWANACGAITYDATFQTDIGGYPQYALLRTVAGTGFWLSTVDNNMSDPETGGANWTSCPLLTPQGGVTPGSYVNASVTVDAFGRITTVSSGSGTLPPSGVTPGTYTLATITVNLEGIVTAASSGTLAGAGNTHFVGALTGVATQTVTAAAPIDLAVTWGPNTVGSINGVNVFSGDSGDNTAHIFLGASQSVIVGTSGTSPPGSAIMSSTRVPYGAQALTVLTSTSLVPGIFSYTATGNERLSLVCGPSVSATVTVDGATVWSPSVGRMGDIYLTLGPGESVTIEVQGSGGVVVISTETLN